MFHKKVVSRGVFMVILLLLVLPNIVMAYVDDDMIEDSDPDTIKLRYVEETAQREFIIDVPHRVESGKSIPIFFEVRDAYGSDYWEYSFYGVEIYDGNNGDKLVRNFSCTDLGLYLDSDSYCTIDTRVWHDVEYLNPDLFVKDTGGNIKITAEYKGASFIDSDAEPDNRPYPLVVQVDLDLIKIPNWYCGDAHYHSSYTDTKFLSSLAGEFGAPIDATVSVLDALGLDWVTVTDHSNSFSDHKNDDIGLSWDDFKSDCSSYDKCLIGTEINCDYNLIGGGNHLLAYDYSGYIEDNFIDVLSPKNPSCEEMISNVNGQGGFTYAAHPESIFDPFGAVVNTWHDYSLGFNGLQIWNGDIEDEGVEADLDAGIEAWKDVLLGRGGLEARKVFVSAGSDAHGDFQNFGKEYTCCYAESYSKENIFEALKNGRCYMGNNGVFVFGIDNLHGDYATLGGEINVLKGEDFEFYFDNAVGEFCDARLYKGIIDGGEELVMSEWIDDYFSSVSASLSKLQRGAYLGRDIGFDSSGYYRFECLTEDGNKRIYTNPIWVNPIECFDDADCGESFLNSSCEDGEFCETGVNYFCRDGGSVNSYCESEMINECNDCKFGCNDTGCIPGVLCAVNSPTDGDVFSERGVVFDVVGAESLDEIEYIDYSGLNPAWRKLCRYCDGYSGAKNFIEGEHDVVVRCSDSFESEGYAVSFFVDSKEPKILGVEPRKGFSNGSFSVVFKEDNPSGVFLHYGEFVKVVDNCVDGGWEWACDVSVDLEGSVEYWFVVEDVAGNSVESEKNVVFVDGVVPVVKNPDSFWKKVEGRVFNYVNFYIEIEEDNFDEVVLAYDVFGLEVEKRVCRDLDDGICEKRVWIKNWYNNVRIVVRDSAGNEVVYFLEGL